MTADREIATALIPLTTGESIVPYPGVWADTPYEVRAGRPVIAEDPGLSALVVDRDRGTVLLLDGHGESVVNSSLAALAECARRYSAAIRTSDADDESWIAIGTDLLAQIRIIDPGVADAEDSFWAVAAEELGYGMHTRSGCDGRRETRGSGRWLPRRPAYRRGRCGWRR
ncbi:SUKH-4 family immunity protein [Micromonospora echinospora]|nr:SUKH-4 family immunity protein [Micromonospora echinospora]